MRAVNLLPAERRGQRHGSLATFVRAHPFALAAAVGVVLVTAGLGVMTAAAGSSVSARRDRLAGLQAQLVAAPQRPSASPSAIATAPARLSAVMAAASKRITWHGFLGDLSRVMPEDVWLLSLSVRSPGAAVTSAAGGSSTATSPTAFAITGYTYAQPSVARLMRRLALVPWLTNVQLQSSTKSAISDRAVYQFTVGADVRSPEPAS